MKNLLCAVLLLLLVVAPLAAGDLYEFSISDEVGFAGKSATVTVSLDSESGDDIFGYSVAVCHDSELLSLDKDGFAKGTAVEELSFLFHAALIVLDDDDRAIGFTVAVVLSIGTVLEPAADLELLLVTYDVSPEAAVGEVALVEFCELGEGPVVSTDVLEENCKFIICPDVGRVDGSIEVVATPEATFLRGDCNDSAGVDLADGVFTLSYLFADGTPPPCETACDADDDAQLDVGDAIFLFRYLFLEGLVLAPPFPECGVGEACLPCETSTGCE